MLGVPFDDCVKSPIDFTTYQVSTFYGKLRSISWLNAAGDKVEFGDPNLFEIATFELS